MYTIKQLADMVGVTSKALRVYEAKELLLPEEHSTAGYRLYSDASLHTLEKICRLRQYQFSLSEIFELLKLPDTILEKKMRQQVGRLLSNADKFKVLAARLNSESKAQPVDATNSALLVINMQNDFTYGCIGFSKAKALVAPLAQFVEYAHRQSIPVIFVNDCHDDNDQKEYYIWGKHAEKGSQGAMLCDNFKVSPADHVIDKHYYSGFFDTGLIDVLNSMQINHLYITGLDSNICVYHTVADAFNFGFRTTLLTDMTEAQYKADYHSSLTFVHENFDTELKESEKISLG